jgi:very-short-patch-repair endonuclease
MKIQMLFPIVLMLILIFVVGGSIARRTKQQNQTDAYEIKETLLTKSEQQLYRILVEALPEMTVLPQVSMNQMFKRFSGQGAQNKISQNSIDFLLCDKSFKIFAAVELNGKSHESKTQRRRDDNKAQALHSAGIPLLTYENRSIPTIEQVRNDVIKVLQS